MDIRLAQNRGCVWVAGSVFSLGLLPLLMRRNARRLPAQLTEEAMVLRNGERIPWGQVTRVATNHVYLNTRYIRTEYVLTHTRGRVVLANDAIQDADHVMAFILGHVPPQALQA